MPHAIRSTLAGVTSAQLAVAVAVQALLLITLAGLFYNGRARRLWMLPVYLLATGIADVLALAAPRIFYVWHAWAVREFALRALSLAMVFELALRVFAALPRAARHGRLVLAGVLVLTAIGLAYVPWHGSELASASWIRVVITEALPRLAYGAFWLCVALIALMSLYRVPSDPLHRAVLGGLAAYLIVYSVGLGTQRTSQLSALVHTITPFAYAALLAYWAWAAWRHEEPPRDVSPEVVRRLHPWQSPGP